MSETNERVTVDFDEESYYLDGKYWESWDNYGEEMADKINELLNEENNKNKNLSKLNKILEGFLLDKGYDFKDIIKFIQERTDRKGDV